MEEPTTGADRIRAIVASVRPNDAGFISVAGVVASVLRRAHTVERQALDATISLAQREMLKDMCAELREMVRAVESGLPGTSREIAPESADNEQWWYALSEATEVLDEQIEQLAAIVGRQEKGSPVRDLAALAVRVLRDHHNELLREARDWMDG